MKVKKSVKKAAFGAGPVPKKKPASKDSVPSEMFPGKMIPKTAVRQGPYITESKKAAPKKKMQKGGSLGMKSVKAGYDKNPGVTRADIIVAAKKEAKYGKKMTSKKMGGKCKYGC